MIKPATEPKDIAMRSAWAWLSLAVGSLVLAGLLAGLLVIGRMPPFDALFTDPSFFRRCLVVHVDLSLVVWFHAFMGLLATVWLAGRDRVTPWVMGTLGVLLLIVVGLGTSAAPALSNYVPAIDHPLFLVGLAVFGLAVGTHLLVKLPNRGAALVECPPAATIGMRAAAFCYLLALLTFALSAPQVSAGLEPRLRYEFAFWGGGHVLQVATVAAMAACWIALLGSALGKSPLGKRAATLLFGALVLPWLASPLLALSDPAGWLHRLGFTKLMQWGIFPAITLLLFACFAAIRRAKREGRLPAAGWKDVRLVAFGTSAALTALGFVLGAMIRGSNTIVPAHYHAAIGAVTAAFMGTTWLLLEPLGLRLPSPRLKRWTAFQPALFGVGQAVFAIGFALAGASGAERKVYGAEQAGRSLEQSIGLGVMGFGGLVAVAGGLLFLWAVISAFADALRSRVPYWRPTWRTTKPVASTPSSD
jgi:hypothetical protein